MVKLTVSVYRFFKGHKAAFWGILIVSTLFFGFFASRITFEEDISKLLPSAKEGGAEDLVFSNLKVKDKIFLQFHSPTGEATPDELAEACDAFAASLLAADSASQAIDNILCQLDEEVFTDAIAFLYECAPMYLDSADYAGLDTLLTPAHAARQMADNYALLRSPAGSAFRSMVMQDPIGLRNLFLAGQGDLASGLGGYMAAAGMTPEFELSVADVEYTGDDTCLVTVDMAVSYQGETETETQVFPMVKDGREWVISAAGLQ